MDSQQFRAAAHAAVEEIANYYDTLPSRPVLSTVSPGYLRTRLPSCAPSAPEPWEQISRDIEAHIMPGITHWQSPKFMAFFPANSSFPGMLGEMWSSALTAPAFNWLCSPAVTELETIVLDWLAQALGLPEGYRSGGEGGGVIQGSASEAIVVAAVSARERYIRRSAERSGLREGKERDEFVRGLRGRLVALGSEQAHSSTQKAAVIAGTDYVAVPTSMSDHLAMTGSSLRDKIEECRAKGLEPFYATVSLGTTATCAVDRFAEIAEVKKGYPDLWVHVDAAYAGAALVCEEYQHMLKGVEEFDSFDMNMHKWLLVNFDASCMFVRHRRDLTDTLSITPSYLKNEASDSGLVTDYRDWQIPLGRRFRALKIWFVMRTYGVSGLQSHIRKHIAMGEKFHSWIRRRSDLFRVLTPPAFALTVFAVLPRDGRDANDVTKSVYEKVNGDGEIFITSSVVKGIYAIRVVSANPLSEEKYLRKAFDVLVRTTEDVLHNSAEAKNTPAIPAGSEPPYADSAIEVKAS